MAMYGRFVVMALMGKVNGFLCEPFLMDDVMLVLIAWINDRRWWICWDTSTCIRIIKNLIWIWTSICGSQCWCREKKKYLWGIVSMWFMHTHPTVPHAHIKKKVIDSRPVIVTIEKLVFGWFKYIFYKKAPDVSNQNMKLDGNRHFVIWEHEHEFSNDVYHQFKQ